MVLISAPTSLAYAPGAQTPGQSSIMTLQAGSTKLNNLNKLSTTGGRRRKRKGGWLFRGGQLVVPILPTAYSGTSPVNNTAVMTQSYKLSANSTAQSALDKALTPATMPVGGIKTGGKKSRRSKSRRSKSRRSKSRRSKSRSRKQGGAIFKSD